MPAMTDTAPAEVAPGVFRLGTPLVNWYLVADGDRLTAVDSGLPAWAKTLEADLASLGFTGMAAKLRDAGARVLIHAADAPKLAEPGQKSGDAAPAKMLKLAWRPSFWRFMGAMARAGGAKPAPVERAETFTDGERLDVPGRPLVVHTPGHTAGHSALLFERRGALFVGDELCTWNPITGERRPQRMPGPFNEDNRAGVQSLGALEKLDAEILLPGHGDPFRGSPAAAVRQARG
jgi:glyoxylase-like metal-dependent hydrolase (beta-lactamase superfamily II)